ncbi:MAG: ExbD/TolR family protein [Deltaproteobacteria bacterium]|jgi:biopolymer transport protein TolR|nr:ExbD/TolR family protein [Deltaproteobacteria bacterium]
MATSLSNDDFVSEINVTPFVDVMLVLLIIFMITAPMMTEGLDVELPEVEESETLPAENDRLILTIKDNGALFVDEYETTLGDIASVLRTNARAAGRSLFVRADRNVSYGTFMEVMGRIRGAGIMDIGLVTLPGPAGAREGSPPGTDGR